MKLSDYLKTKKRGALLDLAKRINAHASDLSRWARNGRPIPIHQCAAIEAATGGLVTRRELRPDDWQKIWPELIEKSGAPIGHAESNVVPQV